MKSWRGRITFGLAIGAAAISIPLTAGAANAVGRPWVAVGGGYDSYQECWWDVADYMDEPYHDHTQFDCRQEGVDWTMYAR